MSPRCELKGSPASSLARLLGSLVHPESAAPSPVAAGASRSVDSSYSGRPCGCLPLGFLQPWGPLWSCGEEVWLFHCLPHICALLHHLPTPEQAGSWPCVWPRACTSLGASRDLALPVWEPPRGVRGPLPLFLLCTPGSDPGMRQHAHSCPWLTTPLSSLCSPPSSLSHRFSWPWRHATDLLCCLSHVSPVSWACTGFQRVLHCLCPSRTTPEGCQCSLFEQSSPASGP